MPPKDFLRFPSDEEGKKYEYKRTANMLIAITASVGLCVVFLALYASVRSPLLFTAAGACAGAAVALWFVTKPSDDEKP